MRSLIQRSDNPTIGQRIIETGGHSSGFDVMRLALAVAVLSWHSILTTYGLDFERPIWNSPYRGLIYLILPMFFALSGFLVAGSLLRAKSLYEFVTLRVLRIVPALFVEICLCSLILGPALTSISLQSYFSDHEFWAYWFNIIGYVHFDLPGLFKTNPFSLVNASLWTIPYELECYAALIVLALMSVARRPFLLFWIVLAATVSSQALGLFTKYIDLEWYMFSRPPGRLLVFSFLAGVALFAARDRIKFNRSLFVISMMASVMLLSSVETMYLAAIPVAYSTVYLGLTNPPKIPIISSGDYSYGVYLYAFPLQQTFIHLFPEYRYWWLNIAFTIVTSFVFAAMSWHLIEWPILKRKKIAIQFVEGIAQYLRNHMDATLAPLFHHFARRGAKKRP